MSDLDNATVAESIVIDADITDVVTIQTSDHAELTHLDYASSNHTGFQKELTAGAGISIAQDGTITNNGVRSIAVNANGSLTIIQGATV